MNCCCVASVCQSADSHPRLIVSMAGRAREATSASVADPHLDRFLDWLAEKGITLDGDVVTIERDLATSPSLPGVGRRWSTRMVSGSHCEHSRVVCTIPKSACLTPITTSCTDRLAEAEIGGPLALIISLMHEVSLGRKSEWRVSLTHNTHALSFSLSLSLTR